MNKPTISALIPFHNPGTHFREAVQSVLAQDCDRFEVILVNNNSDEESLKIAHEFASNYSNVILVDEAKQGIAFALNTGLNHCDGKYIARMDADDICLPDRLKTQSEYLDNHPKAGLVSGTIRLIGSMAANSGMADYIQRINLLKSPWNIYNFRFIDAPFAHPSVMFRKSLIDLYGDYSTEQVPEDFELWLRWFDRGVLMGKVDKAVIGWRDHDSRLSRVHPNYSRKAFDAVRLNYLVIWLRKNLFESLPVYVWGGGKLSRRKVNDLKNAGIKIEGFIDVVPTRKISNYKVMHFTNIPPPGNIFIISMVSNRGKYDEIANYLLDRGYKFDKDFIISG